LRVLLDLADEVGAADQDAGLGAAEQLVAGEGDEVGAVGDGFGRRGFVGQAPAGEVGEGAAAQVFDEGQAVGVGDAGEFGLVDAGGEAFDGVVAGVHLHQQAGARADGGFEIPRVAAVGAADFDEPGARALHDVGHPEGAADLDQLAPRDDDLLALGEGVEEQKDRRGVVVDDGGGFGAGELLQQFVDHVVPVAAAAAGHVVFEGAGRAGGLDHRGDGFFGQHGAAEVGVQHGAAEVEDGLEPRRGAGGEAGFGAGEQGGGAGRRLAEAYRLAGVGQGFAEHAVASARPWRSTRAGAAPSRRSRLGRAR
jgi:hypothetical protein